MKNFLLGLWGNSGVKILDFLPSKDGQQPSIPMKPTAEQVQTCFIYIHQFMPCTNMSQIGDAIIGMQFSLAALKQEHPNLTAIDVVSLAQTKLDLLRYIPANVHNDFPTDAVNNLLTLQRDDPNIFRMVIARLTNYVNESTSNINNSNTTTNNDRNKNKRALTSKNGIQKNQQRILLLNRHGLAHRWLTLASTGY